MEKLLEVLEKNSSFTTAQLAAMLDMDENKVDTSLKNLEANGTIKGYKAVIDWEKTQTDYIIAQIQLKVIPQKNMGFDDIAMKIAAFEEVDSVYLMSGGCDLLLTMSGKSFKEVAMFVALTLAPMDVVQSTATSFVLKKYKESSMLFAEECDEREVTKL